jgi:hypothetical protein
MNGPAVRLDCNDEIIRLIKTRMDKGRKEYGHGLIQYAGYDWLQEALEEALDLSVYLSAKLIELKNLTSSNGCSRGIGAPLHEEAL